MKVRITFRSEVYISGRSINEIRNKWEDLSLYSDEARRCKADFVELVSAEDANTFRDLSDEF